MNKYSLINVSERKNGLVSGVWIQDFTGTKEGVLQMAKNTEKANGNRIDVAVVNCVGGSAPVYDYLTNIKEITN